MLETDITCLEYLNTFIEKAPQFFEVLFLGDSITYKFAYNSCLSLSQLDNCFIHF